MDHTRMRELMELVRSGTKFSDIWNFFADNFGDNADFMILGEGVRDSRIEKIIEYIGMQLYSGKAVLTGVHLLRVAEANLIHGGFCLNGKLGGVIYFEGMDKGLVTIADSPCHYCRFTMAMLSTVGKPPLMGEPSVN